MRRLLEDFIDEMSRARTTEEVGELLRAELANEGYENLVFATTRNRVLKDVVWADLPDGYANAYAENRWDLIDPVLRHVQSARRPFTWDSVRSVSPTTPQVDRFWNECREFGVHSGLTAPMHGPNGIVDIMSVSVRDHAATPAPRLPIVYAMMMQAWLRRSELEVPLVDEKPRLSARELECLKWVRDGKTNWEISKILSISEKTVDFHITNVLKKLDVAGRLEAVLTALKSGIIEL